MLVVVIMKLFQYNYDKNYGMGQGIIIAESIEEAKKLFLGNNVYHYPSFKIEEIDITYSRVIDFSWEE